MMSNAPATPHDIAPGANVSLSVDFSSATAGTFMSSIAIQSNAGPLTVPLSGIAMPAGLMVVTPLMIDFGMVSIGSTVSRSFTVANTGGSPITVARSKPPILGPFVATTTLGEGSTINPNVTLTEGVDFHPTVAGGTMDTWQLNSDDGMGVKIVNFTGIGVVGPVDAGFPPDSGATASDSGTVETDSGEAADGGVTPSDSGTPESDSGTVEPDSGGAPGSDSGVAAHDAGSSMHPDAAAAAPDAGEAAAKSGCGCTVSGGGASERPSASAGLWLLALGLILSARRGRHLPKPPR
jgi:MYXO-CTERM domain-containing protein